MLCCFILFSFCCVLFWFGLVWFVLLFEKGDFVLLNHLFPDLIMRNKNVMSFDYRCITNTHYIPTPTYFVSIGQSITFIARKNQTTSLSIFILKQKESFIGEEEEGGF